MSEQPPLRGDRHYQDEVIRIAELTVNTSLIEDSEFVNCRIIGPAILGLLGGVTISYSTWVSPSLDAMFWPVPPERNPVIGVVGVRNCTFSNCRFEEIGVAAPPEMRAQFEAGITF